MYGLLVALALVAVLSHSGCSVMGYAAGRMVDSHRREIVPQDQTPLLPERQPVWLTLHSGETVFGRFMGAGNPDSLCILNVSKTDTSDPFTTPGRRMIAMDSVRRIEVPGRSYRWRGLGMGAAADAIVVFLAVTADHSSRPVPRYGW